MRRYIYILFFSYVQFCFSQTKDSLNFLAGKDWRTTRGWFYFDSVYMELNSMPDTANMPTEKKLEWLRENHYKEHFVFDKQGKLINYTNYMSCSVGETLYKVLKFNLVNGCIETEHEKKPWRSEKQTIKDVFKISLWTEKKIILYRSKT